jgi:hypothetical protein
MGNMLAHLWKPESPDSQGQEPPVVSVPAVQPIATPDEEPANKTGGQEPAAATDGSPTGTEPAANLLNASGDAEPGVITAPSLIPEPVTPAPPPETPTAPDTEPTGPTPASTPPAVPTPPEPAPPQPKPVAAPPAEIGQMMSTDQVLLKFDIGSQAWQRVAAAEMLYPQFQFVALPTYKPEIMLKGGARVQLLGETKVELLPSTERAPAGIKVDYGRVLVRPPIEAGGKLHVVVGSRNGVIGFQDAESVVALQVTPSRVPGSDPEVQPPLAARLWVQSGQIVWEEGTEPIEVAVGNCLVLAPEGPPTVVPVQQPPEWVASPAALDYWDRQASPVLEQSLRVDRPAILGLMELTVHRRKEVGWLATRCLAYIDEFDPLVTALNDPERKLDWADYVPKLRAAVDRGPSTAAAVRRALEKQYGAEDGQKLFRMLWGYTLEDLRADQAANLVQYLDNETLAFRVLSFWNLKQITGLGLFYKPEQTAAKRAQAVQKWNERLRTGEIVKRAAERPRPLGAK